jgi:hypothetical protein
MSEITTVGLDLAKRVVSLCGEDAGGRVVVQRPLRREAVLGWFVRRPPCLVGMEACASAHGFARELAALGHTARIIAPNRCTRAPPLTDSVVTLPPSARRFRYDEWSDPRCVHLANLAAAS